MLYCSKCNIDYSDDKKFCKVCGNALGAKTSATVSQQQPSPETAVSETGKRSCPTCKAEYEVDKKFCKACGIPLTDLPHQEARKIESPTQDSPQSPQRIQSYQQVVMEKTSLMPKSRIKWFLKRHNKITKKAQKLSILINNLEKQKGIISEDALSITLKPYRTQYDAVKGEMQEIESSFKLLQKELTNDIALKQKELAPYSNRVAELKAIRKAKGLTFGDYRRFRKDPVRTTKRLTTDIKKKQKMLKLLLPSSGQKSQGVGLWIKIGGGVALLVLIAGAGFSGYRYFSTKTGEAGKNGATTKADEVSPQKSIEKVFDTIRQANINKDINLYASCFSRSFPSLEERKIKTMNNWKAYDFSSLNFTFKNLNVKQDKADVIVEWQINARSTDTGQNEIFNTTNTVALIKDGAQWKIARLD